MATAIQRRRGTTAQTANFTGLAGEITIDTDLNTIIVHDGSTAGGYRLAKYTEVEAAATGDITAVVAGSGLTGGASSGNATISIDYENLSGNLVPSANNTYSLGSASNVWKDVYVGPGSLYVNGQQVLSDNSGTITIGADAGQNIAIVTTGAGSVELTSGSGVIEMKSNVQMTAGKTISTAGGGATAQGSNINMNSNNINNLDDPVQNQDAATKAYVDGATYLTGGDGIDNTAGTLAVDSTVVRTTGTQTVAGAKTFSDDIILSGNLTVNGTQTVLNTETLTVDDNIIILNNNASGAPSQNAGIQVNRGDSADVTLQWNESGDTWQFTNDGSTFYNLVKDTDDLPEGSTNEYYTDSKVRNAISVGGDLSYNNGTGVISFTERTDSEVRGLFSGGTGITYNSSTGAISLSDTGYISGVTAGSGLTGGGTDGNVTVNAVGGYGITVNADDIEVANSDIRGLFSAGGDLSYNSSTGVFSFTNDAGDIEGVTAGTGLSGGGTSGTVTLSLATSGVTAATYGDADSVGQFTVDAYGRITAASSVDINITAGAVSGLAASATTDTTSASNISSGTLASARLPDLTVADFAGAAIQTGSESFSDSDTVLMTAAAVQDKILSYGYTTTTGDITGVTAGSGLTGGGSSGGVTLNVGAGSYITVAADTVAVDATSTNTASKVVARDASGNFAAGTITATATNAQYADLAENYEADEELEAGTVVCFGGDKEITACEVEGHHAVAGVISTDPAHLMNSECPGIALPVALAGRVPCKVVGPVNKGDLMIASSVKGHAKADNDAPAGRIIGKAIGSNEDGEGVVEVLVNMM